FPRENIDGAQRQDRQSGPFEPIRYVAEPVQHLVHRPVTSGRNHGLEAFVYCLRSQPASISGAAGEFKCAERPYVIEVSAESPGLFASSHRVENDAYAHGTLFGEADVDSRGETDKNPKHEIRSDFVLQIFKSAGRSSGGTPQGGSV